MPVTKAAEKLAEKLFDGENETSVGPSVSDRAEFLYGSSLERSHYLDGTLAITGTSDKATIAKPRYRVLRVHGFVRPVV